MPQNITTENDLVSWLHLTFPQFGNSDIAKVLLYYPSSNASVDPNAPEYATSGYTGATAINESAVGTGQQQRANVGPPSNLRCHWLMNDGRTFTQRLRSFVQPTGWLKRFPTLRDSRTSISTR